MIKIPASDRLAVTNIGGSTDSSRWRTEGMRAHHSPRLIFVTKGQGRITIQGSVRGFGPNNLFFLPQGTLYGMDMGATAFAQVVTIPRELAADWPEEVVHLRLRDVSGQKALTHHLDQLDHELSCGTDAGRRAAHCWAGLLAVQVARLQDTSATPETTDTPAERLVAAYADLVARDFRSGAPVASYAARLGVTPTHLTRSCKATSGKSALQLLNDRKLYEARVLLRNSDRPVGEIATHLGFRSPAYFTRAFHRETGVTPSAFRSRGPVAVC